MRNARRQHLKELSIKAKPNTRAELNAEARKRLRRSDRPCEFSRTAWCVYRVE